MTPRERVQSALRHEETDIVPYFFDFTPPARAKLARRLGRSDVEDAIGNHLALIGPMSQKPLYAPPERFGDEIVDEFGVTWHTDPFDRGVVKRPALPEPSLAGYVFPAAELPERFDDVAERISANEGRFIVATVGDLFERATFMRGVGAFLEDIAARPRFVEELLDGILDFVLRTEERMLGLPVDATFLSDDYGHQDRLAISPRDWRRLIKPRLAEVLGRAKGRGKATMLHSCGHIEDIVQDLIEIGLDILHPTQPEANDIFELKRRYGRDITFCGGVGTQRLLPSATPAQVRDEVRQLKQVMGKGGGFILAPGITIQHDAPVENVLAMIEEAQAPVAWP